MQRTTSSLLSQSTKVSLNQCDLTTPEWLSKNEAPKKQEVSSNNKAQVATVLKQLIKDNTVFKDAIRILAHRRNVSPAYYLTFRQDAEERAKASEKRAQEVYQATYGGQMTVNEVVKLR